MCISRDYSTESGDLSEDGLEKSGLTSSVSPDDSNLITLGHSDVIGDADNRYVVTDYEVFEFEDFFGEMRGGFEDYRFHMSFGGWFLDFLHAFEHLDTTLYARCSTRFVAKTIDVGFLFFYLAFLHFIMLELSLVAFLFFYDIGVVISCIDVEFLLRDLHDFLTGIIDKGDIVRDRDYCLFPQTTEVLEEYYALDIQMVRRFI